MFRTVKYWGVLVLFWLISCKDSLEYSPNVTGDQNTPRNLNAINLDRLRTTPGDDTVRFILSGDTQRGSTEARDFVNLANRIPGLDFVVVAGDISDFGLLQEMEWITGIYAGLRVPYLGVIGNHDMAAKGRTIFRQIFGEPDYSFIYQGYKFVCLNTNSREVFFDGTVPDQKWLDQQMRPHAGVRGFVAISHVTPFSVDFDKNMEAGYVAALERSGNCLASLHAHDHKAGQYRPYANQIPFIVSGAIVGREFTLIEIINGKLHVQEMEY